MLPAQVNKYTKLVLAIVFFYTILITAWLSDESFITFRQVLNFINHHEISWQLGNKIQVFTHPAWFILLSAIVCITQELYITTIVVSVSLSLLSIYILYKYADEVYSINKIAWYHFFLALLLFSQSFMDYTTSGLEQPLSYFLSGLVILISYKIMVIDRSSASNYMYLYIIFALIVINSIDLVILFLPLVLYSFINYLGVKKFFMLVPGISLLILWFGFASFYFGMPISSSIYAGYYTDYGVNDYFTNGVKYYLATAISDPMSLAIIALGIVSGFLNQSNQNLSRCLSFGLSNYLFYILLSGGDYMQSKLFAVPVYIAMFNIVDYFIVYRFSNFFFKASFISLIILALPFSAKPFLSDYDYKNYFVIDNIIDKRGWDYQDYGVFAKFRIGWPKIYQDNLTNSDSIYRIDCTKIGLTGLSYPNTKWLDTCGRTDYYVTSMTADKSKPLVSNRVERLLPNIIGNKSVSRVNIYNLNINKQYLYDGASVDLEKITEIKKELNILVSPSIKANKIKLSLDNNNYKLILNSSFTYSLFKKISKNKYEPIIGLVNHELVLDREIEINNIVIVPLKDNTEPTGKHTLGHLLFLENKDHV